VKRHWILLGGFAGSCVMCPQEWWTAEPSWRHATDVSWWHRSIWRRIWRVRHWTSTTKISVSRSSSSNSRWRHNSISHCSLITVDVTQSAAAATTVVDVTAASVAAASSSSTSSRGAPSHTLLIFCHRLLSEDLWSSFWFSLPYEAYCTTFV